MFELSEDNRYFLCRYPVTMNKGIDGLCRIVESYTPFSPVSGDCYIFFSRNRKQVKILKWDTDGFLLYQKRLAKGRFELPVYNEEAGCHELSWATFYFIIRGIDFETVRYHNRFRMRSIKYASI